MKAMVNVGNDAPVGEAASSIAAAICQILEAGHEFRHEQNTIVRALEAFRNATSINGVSISGSSFYATPEPPDEVDG